MWAAPYNTSDPIEYIFDRLEECFVVAIVAKPAYSTEKTVDKALIAIQLTSLYSIAILEWNVIDEVIQTWPEFKSHFTKAYDIRICSGAGTAGTMGYPGAISRGRHLGIHKRGFNGAATTGPTGQQHLSTSN